MGVQRANIHFAALQIDMPAHRAEPILSTFADIIYTISHAGGAKPCTD